MKRLGDVGSFNMDSGISGASILQSAWDFKKKRYTDGILKKYKVPYCAQGDQQIEGVDALETYTPLVSLDNGSITTYFINCFRFENTISNLCERILSSTFGSDSIRQTP